MPFDFSGHLDGGGVVQHVEFLGWAGIWNMSRLVREVFVLGMLKNINSCYQGSIRNTLSIHGSLNDYAIHFLAPPLKLLQENLIGKGQK
jgi:hypothetical protein